MARLHLFIIFLCGAGETLPLISDTDVLREHRPELVFVVVECLWLGGLPKSRSLETLTTFQGHSVCSVYNKQSWTCPFLLQPRLS